MHSGNQIRERLIRCRSSKLVFASARARTTRSACQCVEKDQVDVDQARMRSEVLSMEEGDEQRFFKIECQIGTYKDQCDSTS